MELVPSWLKHMESFIYVHVETPASCCLLQIMFLGFGLSRCIFNKAGRMKPLVHFSIVICLQTALHDGRYTLSNVLVFYTSGDISARFLVFLLLLFFFNSTSSFIFENCQSLMSS